MYEYIIIIRKRFTIMIHIPEDEINARSSCINSLSSCATGLLRYVAEGLLIKQNYNFIPSRSIFY